MAVPRVPITVLTSSKSKVDLTNLLNQFGDACAGVEEHFVGLFKAFAHRGVFSELFFELIVKNDNERVDATF